MKLDMLLQNPSLPLNKVRYILFILCFVFVAQYTEAQRIKIKESIEPVLEQNVNGMYIVLELDKKYVEKAWLKYLKNYGKTERKGEVQMIPVANVSAISSYPCKIYSIIAIHSDGTKVWWAFDLTTNFVTSKMEREYKEVEKMMYEFAVTAYRDDINRQISDAEDALEKAVSKQEKEVEEGMRLNEKIADNKKSNLEQKEKLQKTKDEYQRINRDIDYVIQQQKLTLDKIEKIKREHDSNNSQELHKQLQDAVDIQHEKAKESVSLSKEIEKNKKTKAELEAKIKKNEDELQLLNQELDQNKLDQAAAMEDVEKMKKAVEIVKSKLGSIEN